MDIESKKRSTPLVSVIIPVFNVKKYLSRCLDSVVKQTYQELEILIIDDGSTDGCGAICDEYKNRDRRIRVFHTENRGLSAARNMGLDEAKGEYISFIDSDDWFENDAIEMSSRVMRDSDADIVCFRYAREYKDASKLQNNQVALEPLTLIGEEVINEFCFGSNIGSVVWNKLYNAQLFSKIRFPIGRLFEDDATTHLLLLESNLVICIPNVLIHYRARDNSITGAHDLTNISDRWWACKKRYEDLAIISDDYGKAQMGSCMNAISRMWRWYSGLSEDEKKYAKPLIKMMQCFAMDHREEILINPTISKFDKAVCFCSVTTNPIVMRILYVVNQIFRHLSNREMLFEE